MLVEQGRHLVATFHPELTADARVHRCSWRNCDARRKKRVLFVCIGNSCRSQMAEGFARAYGSDVLIAGQRGADAGLRAWRPTPQRAMVEKNIDLRDHFPKHIRQLGRAHFDLVVNMSGVDLEGSRRVRHSMGLSPTRFAPPIERHCEIRDEIERLVMNLVLDLRRKNPDSASNGGM